MRPVLLLSAAMLCACSQNATPAQCDAVAERLAQLKVKKEQQPPFGKLTIAPFNGPAEVKAMHDESRDGFKERCTKGWRKAAVDCMMAADSLESAEACRAK